MLTCVLFAIWIKYTVIILFTRRKKLNHFSCKFVLIWLFYYFYQFCIIWKAITKCNTNFLFALCEFCCYCFSCYLSSTFASNAPVKVPVTTLQNMFAGGEKLEEKKWFFRLVGDLTLKLMHDSTVSNWFFMILNAVVWKTRVHVRRITSKLLFSIKYCFSFAFNWNEALRGVFF